jgi:hypothetical protein
MSIEEFADLATTGFQGGGGGGEQKPPEEELFHSVYIAGKTRKNHINVEEQTGKYQIRGVQYNLDEVHMIITHVKEVLLNSKREKNKDNIVCFSFKDGAPPWYGTSKLTDGSQRQCPQTSAERAVNDFCNPCRAQIIVAGIYCKQDGSPILTEENKPIFVFIRGKGMRYPNVSNYLNDRYQEDLTPLFEPVTDQSREFEKSVVNNKRFVTKLSKGTETSSYGNDVKVFVLSKGVEIPKESVLSILKLSKQTVKQFNEKFDWSKKKGGATGYGSAPDGVLSTDPGSDEPAADEDQPEEKAKEAGATGKTFSFDDVNF